MDAERLLRRADRDVPRLGRPGLSAAAGDTNTPLAILASASQIPHSTIRVTTARRLREEGFTIERSFGWPHCTIWIGDTPEITDLERFAACFGEPQDNPAAVRRNP
jgi:hypothetical protein